MEASERPAVLLLARSAIAAIPIAEMQRLTALVAAGARVASAHYAFSEQGTPAFRETLLEMVEQAPSSILILPLMLPAEPSYLAWLGRSIARWQASSPADWPPVRIGAPLGDLPEISLLLNAAIDQRMADQPEILPRPKAREGSVVPPQRHRMLVCHGGPCTAAGAAVIWGHLRNEQARQSLRTTGDGMMSAKTTCLGPCNLAPVVQVCPDNSYYGGVDEKAIDAIIAQHILGGTPAEDYIYASDGRKQFLRAAEPG